MIDLKELESALLVKIHRNLGSLDDEHLQDDRVIPGIRENITKDPASAKMYFSKYPAHICSRLFHSWKANLERAKSVQYLIGVYPIGEDKLVIVGIVRPTQWNRAGDRIFCIRANDAPQDIIDKYVGQVISIKSGRWPLQYYTADKGLEEEPMADE